MKTIKLHLITSVGALGLLATAAAQPATPPADEPAAQPAQTEEAAAPAEQATPPAPGRSADLDAAVRNVLEALQAVDQVPPLTTTNSVITLTGNQAPGQTQSTVMGGTNLATLLDKNATVPASTNATGGGVEALNLVNAPLSSVLQKLADAAGFTISSRVPLSGRVTLITTKRLSREELLKPLNEALVNNGYGAYLQDDGVLKIVTASDLKTYYGKIVKGSDPSNIPVTEEIVTQSLPIKYVDASQLAQLLQQLLPQGITMSVSAAANAIIMQDTQAYIHRAAQLIQMLDTSLAVSAKIKVYALTNADAKSLATIIQTIFASQGRGGGAAAIGGLPGGFGNLAQMFGGGGRGGRGGGGGGGGGGVGNINTQGRVQAPQTVATSDDRSNMLVVSGTEEQIAQIDKLVAEMDVNVDDITEVRKFKLEYADPGETANVLAAIFPNTTSTSQGGGRGGQVQTAGRGGRGGRGAGAVATDTSGRMLKQSQVIATPDYRTSSLVVSASRILMPQIKELIEELDADPAGRQEIYSWKVEMTDPASMLYLIQSLIPSQSGTTGARAGVGQTGGTFNRTATATGIGGAQGRNAGGGLGGGMGGGGLGGGGTGRSDRNLKDNFASVDTQAVLAKVASLPITTWNYKDDTGTRHLGPMAQDFYSAFGVGQNDKTITFLDEGGVALAAVQGLNQKLEEKDAKIKALEKELSEIKALVQTLVTKSNGGVGASSSH